MPRVRLLAAFFPSFPLQVAVRAAPGLKGRSPEGGQSSDPFAVADVDLAASGRREVPPNADLLAVSSAARRAGVRIGMTVTQARVLCPGIVVRPRDPAAHEAARIAAAEVLSGFGPRVEVSEDGDVAWVDLTGEAPEAEGRVAREAAARLKSAGFVARIAVAGDRFTARAVAEFARAQTKLVDDARAALAGLPVEALGAPLRGASLRGASALGAPAQRGGESRGRVEARRAVAKALEIFPRLGITTLGQVAALPADTLARRFGADAARYGALARGEDATPLVPFRIPAALFEKIDMPAPAEQVEPLLFALKMLADRVGARLTGRGRASSKLAVHLVLEHAPGMSMELRLPRPTVATKTILEIARERFSRIRIPGAVTEMALEVVDSVPTRRTQLALFDEEGVPIDPRRAPPSPEKLAVTLGRLATAFGDGAVFAARLADEHRPERAFAPAPLELEGIRKETGRETGKEMGKGLGRKKGKPTLARAPTRSPAPAPAPSPDPDAVRPVRVLRTPEEISFQPPRHGREAELVVRGHRHRVDAIRGPERQAGEWWDAPYDRDYYFVRTDDGSAWWIFHDRARGDWRLHGLFD